MYIAGEFFFNTDLHIITYKKKPIVSGCDDVIKFFLELGLATSDFSMALPHQIEHEDISEEELEYLESMLRIAILDDKVCSECCT